MAHAYAPYNASRDQQARLADPHINKILSKEYDISEDDITDPTMTEDHMGIDKFIKVGDITKTVQVKNIKYCKFDTVTIPCAKYNEYIDNEIDVLFHSYYNHETPTKIRQYAIIDFKELDQIPKDWHNSNARTGTEFYVWKYSTIKDKCKVIQVL